MNMIEFTPSKIEGLMQAYQKAVSKSDEEFTFDGRTLDIRYAKYLLQYLHTTTGGEHGMLALR